MKEFSREGDAGQGDFARTCEKRHHAEAGALDNRQADPGTQSAAQGGTGGQEGRDFASSEAEEDAGGGDDELEDEDRRGEDGQEGCVDQLEAES